MTTIAIDRTHVAADGLRTWGDEIRGTNHQKIRVSNGMIYALTGSAPMFGPAVEWHEKGADPKTVPKCDGREWTLIVVDSSGIVTKWSDTCPYPESFDAPIAFGAGADLAMGAMLAGASARRAVELVAGLHVHTGGTIREIEIASLGRQLAAE